MRAKRPMTLNTSPLITSWRSLSSPVFARLALMVRTASGDASTMTALAAPRDRASSAMHPLPENRSRKSHPSMSNCHMLNSDSRIMSVTGRVSKPFGASIALPRALPAIILMLVPFAPNRASDDGRPTTAPQSGTVLGVRL